MKRSSQFISPFIRPFSMIQFRSPLPDKILGPEFCLCSSSPRHHMGRLLLRATLEMLLRFSTQHVSNPALSCSYQGNPHVFLLCRFEELIDGNLHSLAQQKKKKFKGFFLKIPYENSYILFTPPPITSGLKKIYSNLLTLQFDPQYQNSNSPSLSTSVSSGLVGRSC